MIRWQTSVGFRAFCLDQLDCAREHLDHEDVLNGRIAHILSDNVAELILHYQAEHIDGFKWSKGAPRQQIERLVPAALGRDLKPKLRLAKLIGMLTDSEAAFVSINHEYRNEVYHRGLIHDRVIWDLAWHYQGFVCKLLGRVKTFGETYSLEFQVPKRLERFSLDKQDLFRTPFSGESRLNEICDSISRKNSQPKNALGDKLSVTILEDIDELNGAIEFVAKYDRRMKTREQVIVQSQLWSIFGRKELPKGYKLIPGAPSLASLRAAGPIDPVVALSQIIRPPVYRDLVPSWKSRGESIALERDPLVALIKYQALRDSFQAVYESVLRGAAGLSDHMDAVRKGEA
jgi:hypothetical protein